MEAEFSSKDRFQLHPKVETSPDSSRPKDPPSPPPFSTVPSQISVGAHRLRSQSRTIDELMGQNEDLMARLMVALRRAGDLEAQLNLSLEAKGLFKNQLEQLQDQLLILKQKDEWASERVEAREEELNKLREDHRLLETQYAEYYLSSKTRIAQVKKELDQVYRSLNRFKKHKGQLVRIATHYRHLFRQSKAAEQSLTQKMAEEKDVRKQLQIQLGQAGERIQSLKQQMDEAASIYQRTLDVQKKQQANELASFKNEQIKISDLLIKIETEEAQKVQLQNEKLHIERQLDLLRQKTELETNELQQQLKNFRLEAKSKTIAVDHLESEKVELIDENNLLAKQRSELTHQVETLQSLWQAQQHQIEKLENKNRSLQNLNRQMSRQISDLRRSNVSKIEALQTTSSNRTAGSTSNESRVDLLFLELQSGFSSEAKGSREA